MLRIVGGRVPLDINRYAYSEYDLFLSNTQNITIIDTIDDLFAYLRFLHVDPFTTWANFYRVNRNLDLTFPKDISKGFRKVKVRIGGNGIVEQQKDASLKLVRDLLSKYMLRRLKTDHLDGKPLIRLPEKTVHLDIQPFNKEEQGFYDVLFKRAQTKFNEFVSNGTGIYIYSALT